eukprot:363738-Chlamydomonas_euryale.AAC.13
MRGVIRKLAHRFPTAIISGRGREKVENFVQLRELYYAGSHGMDIAGPPVRAEQSHAPRMHAPQQAPHAWGTVHAHADTHACAYSCMHQTHANTCMHACTSARACVQRQPHTSSHESPPRCNTQRPWPSQC